VAQSSRFPRRAVLVLIVLTLIWGYSWPVVKIALFDAPVLPFAALRTLIGALGLLVYLRFFSSASFRPVALKPILVLAVLQTSGFSILSVLPVLTGGAGKTSVLVFTMPFWLLLFAHPVLGERIRGAQWLSVLLAFAGLALIIEPWELRGTLPGNLCAVAAGACWAASAVYVKWYRARHPVNLANLTAWQMAVGAIPLLLLAWTVPAAPVHWTMSFAASIVFLGLFSNALGWVLWMYVLQRLPAGVAGLSTLAIPAIAVIAAWIHFGERPEAGELTGMVLIGVALAILAALGVRQRRLIGSEMGTE
jgi:drug/metabolite transporter (DMT)-like permease